MGSKFRTLFLTLLQILVVLCITSCAVSPVKMSAFREFDVPKVEINNKIPLRAGLYLSQGFKNASFYSFPKGRGIKANPIASHHSFIGDALISSSQKAVKNIFQDVVILDGKENDVELKAKQIDMIVTPELVKVDSIFLAYFSFTECDYTIKTLVKWTIASLAGVELYSNTITSDEIRITVKKPITQEEKLKEAIILSLQDNFKRAQEDIYSSGWWKNQWWKNSK